MMRNNLAVTLDIFAPEEQCDYGENRSQCNYDDNTAAQANELPFNVANTSISNMNETYARCLLRRVLKSGLVHLNANAMHLNQIFYASASENAQQLSKMQMQIHLDQIQLHLDEMQKLFYNYVFLRSASDILLSYLVTTINDHND